MKYENMKNWVFLLYTKHGITIIFRPPIQNSTFIDYSFLFRSYILMKITKSLKELENFFLKKCVWRHLEAQPFLLLLCVCSVFIHSLWSLVRARAGHNFYDPWSDQDYLGKCDHVASVGAKKWSDPWSSINSFVIILLNINFQKFSWFN